MNNAGITLERCLGKKAFVISAKTLMLKRKQRNTTNAKMETITPSIEIPSTTNITSLEPNKVVAFDAPKRPRQEGNVSGFDGSGNLIPGAYKGWWETNPEKLLKLEQAFAQGNNDVNACAYAEITERQLYYYCHDINPEFVVRKEQLKTKPILAALQTVVKAVTGYSEIDGKGVKRTIKPDVGVSQWYLERKLKKEFSTRTELTGGEGKDLFELSKEDKEKLDAIINGREINPHIIEAEQKQLLSTSVVPGTVPNDQGNTNGTEIPSQ